MDACKQAPSMKIWYFLLQAHTQLFTLQTETEILFTSSQNLMQVLLIFFMPLLKLTTPESEIYFYNENVAFLSSKP